MCTIVLLLGIFFLFQQVIAQRGLLCVKNLLCVRIELLADAEMQQVKQQRFNNNLIIAQILPLSLKWSTSSPASFFCFGFILLRRGYKNLMAS